jgi:hypothetical protein
MEWKRERRTKRSRVPVKLPELATAEELDVVRVLDKRIDQRIVGRDILVMLLQQSLELRLHAIPSSQPLHCGTKQREQSEKQTHVLEARLLPVQVLQPHVALRVGLHVRQRRCQRETPRPCRRMYERT